MEYTSDQKCHPKQHVVDMAVKQGFTWLKFTNKKGVELPNTNWIAGVDYDDDLYHQNDASENNKDEDESEDEDFIPEEDSEGNDEETVKQNREIKEEIDRELQDIEEENADNNEANPILDSDETNE